MKRYFDDSGNPKHGIHIKKGKSTQIKYIYNNGYISRRYCSQPLKISFKSKMINDANQNFCGGWSITGFDGSDKALVRRVARGLKPMGVIHGSIDELSEYTKQLDANTIDYKIIHDSKNKYSPYTLMFSTKGKCKDLFDLKTLYYDYKDAGITIDIGKISGREIKTYFKCWDIGEEGTEPWETGLILGYPIENTISLYKNH